MQLSSNFLEAVKRVIIRMSTHKADKIFWFLEILTKLQMNVFLTHFISYVEIDLSNLNIN